MPTPMTLAIENGPEVHELVEAARRQCWYAMTPFGFPAFLRYRDCERLLRDRRFREVGMDLLDLSGITEGPLYDWYSLIMFANDGDAHRRLRNLVSLAFTPKNVEACRPHVRSEAERLCGEQDGEVELVRTIAHWMPVLAVSEMLGIPRDDVALFGDWSARLGAIFSVFLTPEIRHDLEETLAPFTEYVTALVADRRAHPRDDLTTRLVEARDGGDRLTEPELIAMIANLVIGGHDATERLIANAMWTLLQHPDQWRGLVDDATLLPGAIEEVLRYEPSAGGGGRVALEDVDWEGVAISAGSMVGIFSIAANRDPEVFADPHRFDIRRGDVRHLTFGGGPHYCLGASLGRVVAQETVGTIARRWPTVELLEDDPPWAPVEKGFRGITRLRLGVRP